MAAISLEKIGKAYSALELSPPATLAEIKAAFRKKAKALHPDLAQSEDSTAFSLLRDAYQTLLDAAGDELCERFFGDDFRKRQKSFDYRAWLLECGDEKSMAKLVLFDLLHSREDLAVAEYKNLAADANFSLEKHLLREDFMDFGVFLAEELSARGHFYDAYLLLTRIVRMEREKPYFRYFFNEIMRQTHEVIQEIVEREKDDILLDVLEDALDLGFSANKEARFLIRIAEVYRKYGEDAIVKSCVDEALRLNSRIHVPDGLR